MKDLVQSKTESLLSSHLLFEFQSSVGVYRGKVKHNKVIIQIILVTTGGY